MYTNHIIAESRVKAEIVDMKAAQRVIGRVATDTPWAGLDKVEATKAIVEVRTRAALHTVIIQDIFA